MTKLNITILIQIKQLLKWWLGNAGNSMPNNSILSELPLVVRLLEEVIDVGDCVGIELFNIKVQL